MFYVEREPAGTYAHRADIKLSLIIPNHQDQSFNIRSGTSS